MKVIKRTWSRYISLLLISDMSDGTCSDKSGPSDYPRTYQALITHYAIYVCTLFRYLALLG